jgi:hypothetical protein
MELRKFIATTIRKYLNENVGNSIESFQNKASMTLMDGIEGGFLNKKQGEDLQKEIESKYIESSRDTFDRDFDDIRQNIYNYDSPIAQKNINGIDIRVVEGLIRDGRKTYLLYFEDKIVGEFYSVSDIKKTIKFIEDNLIKELK